LMFIWYADAISPFATATLVSRRAFVAPVVTAE